MIPTLVLDLSGVPLVFRHNCALWQGTARRITTEGNCVDTDRVRVRIVIEANNYAQTNSVRIGTPSEILAQYRGQFLDGKLVFPLTDEVHTLAGEKATPFSGIAWPISGHVSLCCGSRTLPWFPMTSGRAPPSSTKLVSTATSR